MSSNNNNSSFPPSADMTHHLPQIVSDLTQTPLPFLEMALQAVHNGIVITDCNQPDNPIIYANPGFELLTGYTRQEIIGLNCRFLQGQDWDQPAIVELKAAIKEGRATTVVLRNYRRDGKCFYNELHLSPVYNSLGHLTNFIGIQTDVTTRIEAERAKHKAEEELIQYEQRFRALIENSDEMITLTDAKGKVLYQSPAVASVMGYTLQELAGRNSFEMVHPDDIAKLLADQHKLLSESGVGHRNEFRFRHKDGSWHYIETHAQNLLHVPGVEAIVVNGRDITSRKQTEAALHESEARLSGIINSATEAIITLDSQQRVVVFNTAAETMFGCKIAEVAGTTIEDLLPQRYRQTHSVHITKFGQTGTTMRTMGTLSTSVLTALRRNGEEFPIEASISQLKIAGQKFYTVIIRDITERKKVEESLSRSEAQLRQAQKMDAVGQLAGGIAHDFNNLLTIMTSYSELILLGLKEQDPLYQDVSEIKHAADRAARLTRQLLAFSRQQILQPTILNLNEVIVETNRMLHRLIGENIQVVTLLDPQLGSIKADQGQLEQMLVNLAVNARDAMPKGGTLTFETKNVELDEEYVLYHPYVVPGRYARLAVKDTGVGMSETVRSRIFEPFFTTKERGRGTGLGLSTVYGIIKQSGGHIEVSSEVGRGSSFELYLPVISVIKPASNPEQASNPAVKIEHTELQVERVPRETVLLVEDEEGVRNLIIRILDQVGYKVLEATDGREALLLAESMQGQAQIDLLITDIMMPHLSGLDLAQRLASLQPTLRVLYISGYADQLELDHKVLSEYERLENFLHKPFSPQSLVSKVRELLDRDRAR